MKNSLTAARPLLVFAHKGEAQAFLTHFKASPVSLPSLGNTQIFECASLFILLTGEGRTGAAEKLAEVFTAFPQAITKVINLGIAGALTKELPLETVVLIQNIFALEGQVISCTPTTGGWITANLFTSDKRVLGASDALALAKVAPLVDREAHGLAQAAQLYNLPFIALKIVSDLPWEAEDEVSDYKYQKLVQKNAPKWSALLLHAFGRLT